MAGTVQMSDRLQANSGKGLSNHLSNNEGQKGTAVPDIFFSLNLRTRRPPSFSALHVASNSNQLDSHVLHGVESALFCQAMLACCTHLLYAENSQLEAPNSTEAIVRGVAFPNIFTACANNHTLWMGAVDKTREAVKVL